jgi:putative transposase
VWPDPRRHTTRIGARQCSTLHLLVEADGPTEFERGVRGLAIRVAKAVNRALGRAGRVWAERYHARLLRTPREVRNALVYILNNFRKHLRGARGLDPCSSARWFNGWRSAPVHTIDASPVAPASTWLARVGWRRHGLIDVDEGPRPARARRPE